MTKYSRGRAPSKGTKIRPTAFYGDKTDGLGTICVVTGYDPDHMHGVAVRSLNNESDGYGFAYATEWEPVGVLDSLTDDQRRELAKAARASAKARGYCDETNKVLNDLGLNLKTKRKVTIEFEVEESDNGKTFASDPNKIGVMTAYNKHNSPNTGINILSAKVVSQDPRD